jgi:hypothetical protein
LILTHDIKIYKKIILIKNKEDFQIFGKLDTVGALSASCDKASMLSRGWARNHIITVGIC